jgi:hypothetical protein
VSDHPTPAPCGHERADKCVDCGRRYGAAHGFPDLVVPHEVWAKISPTGDEAGLVCPSCMCQRAHAAGLSGIPARFTSGPFCATPTGTPAGETTKCPYHGWAWCEEHGAFHIPRPPGTNAALPVDGGAGEPTATRAAALRLATALRITADAWDKPGTLRNADLVALCRDTASLVDALGTTVATLEAQLAAAEKSAACWERVYHQAIDLADKHLARAIDLATEQCARAIAAEQEAERLLGLATPLRAWFDAQVHVSGRAHAMPWLPQDLLTALVEDYDARYPAPTGETNNAS